MKFKSISIDVKNPKIRIVVLLLLLIGGGTYFWYDGVIRSKMDVLQNIEGEYSKKQNDLLSIFAMKPQLSALNSMITQMNKELEDLKSKFPDKKEIPRLIQQITYAAKKEAVQAVRFQPLPDVEKENYIENNYAMAVVGGYHELAAFFANIANLELIVNLSNVVIERNPEIEASIKENEIHGGGVQTVKATFNLTTFSSKK